MKKHIILFCISILIIHLNFQFYDYEENYEYTPVLMKRADLEKSIKYTDARNLETPGKIYAKDNYLFINEKYEGVHVIDNTDPAYPQNIGFINAPGSIDMAIKENVLYLDNAVDLVAVNLDNFPSISVTKRITNIFPEPFPPGYSYIPDKYLPSNRPKGTILVKWLKRGETD